MPGVLLATVKGFIVSFHSMAECSIINQVQSAHSMSKEEADNAGHLQVSSQRAVASRCRIGATTSAWTLRIQTA